MECEGLLNLQNHTHNLLKIQEFQSWSRKIKPLFHLLGKLPLTDLEIRLCSDENQLTDEDPLLNDPVLLNSCQALYEDLLQLVNQKKNEALEIWVVLQEQWGALKENEDFHLTFTCAESGIIKALQDLHSQFILREDDKRQRIAAYIGELRNEISKIWEQCMITEEEKQQFEQFYTEMHNFSEEILDIHKEELIKWQIYHEKNQEILVKIKRREDMWSKLRELEARAEDPNRFVNRGGALLKDQNMHNFIMKSLPKLESELVKLADQFEKEHERKMKIRGKEIPSMIAEEWKVFKEEKASRKNTRANQTANPSTSVTSSTPSVLSRHRQSMMPIQGTSNVRHMEKRPATRAIGAPTPLAKRGKCESKDSVKGGDD